MTERQKKAALIAFATTIMGQVYLTPFNTTFRLSLGITMMTFLLIALSDAPIRLTGLFTGISILAFRSMLDLFQIQGLTPMDLFMVLKSHYPAAIFYFTCGIIFDQIGIRMYRSRPVYFVMLVTVTDAFTNILEVMIRNEFSRTLAEPIITRLIITGLVRSTLAYLLIVAFRAMNMLILREEHQQRYNRLLFFTANMKSELFFLNKSMHDIETAMALSFGVYKDLQGKPQLTGDEVHHIRKQLLTLSNDIHEIKKDHLRATLGLQKLLPNPAQTSGMKISAVGKLLQDNTGRVTSEYGKDINVQIRLNDNLKIRGFYPLITILNNMIMNSIEAMENGRIVVSMDNPDTSQPELITFYVRDNGSGIPEDDIPHVFIPGFSTKYSDKTGEMSQGIGLAHAKSLAEQYFKGSVEVSSTTLSGTIFTIKLNKDILVKGRRTDESNHLYH